MGQQHNHKAGSIRALTASQLCAHCKEKFVSSELNGLRLGDLNNRDLVGNCMLHTRNTRIYITVSKKNYHTDLKKHYEVRKLLF